MNLNKDLPASNAVQSGIDFRLCIRKWRRNFHKVGSGHLVHMHPEDLQKHFSCDCGVAHVNRTKHVFIYTQLSIIIYLKRNLTSAKIIICMFNRKYTHVPIIFVALDGPSESRDCYGTVLEQD